MSKNPEHKICVYEQNEELAFQWENSYLEFIKSWHIAFRFSPRKKNALTLTLQEPLIHENAPVSVSSRGKVYFVNQWDENIASSIIDRDGYHCGYRLLDEAPYELHCYEDSFNKMAQRIKIIL